MQLPGQAKAQGVTVKDGFNSGSIDYSVSGGSPGGTAPAPPVPPAAVAGSFSSLHGADLLGRPAPSIAPGYALAGKLGYLETHAQTERQFSNPTPLGPLTISARGTFLVDWGDGTGQQGP